MPCKAGFLGQGNFSWKWRRMCVIASCKSSVAQVAFTHAETLM